MVFARMQNFYFRRYFSLLSLHHVKNINNNELYCSLSLRAYTVCWIYHLCISAYEINCRVSRFAHHRIDFDFDFWMRFTPFFSLFFFSQQTLILVICRVQQKNLFFLNGNAAKRILYNVWHIVLHRPNKRQHAWHSVHESNTIN